MRLTSTAGVVVLLAVTAACTSTDASPEREDAPAPAPLPVAWSAVDLPDGFDPSLLAPGPDGGVLVAADGEAGGGRGPRLIEIVDGEATELPVAAESYYGRRVVWRGAATAGRRVLAFGGRSGGAHGITRWTAWSGTLGPAGHLAEDVQDFETFGGPAAGGLAGVVAPPDAPPLLLGSRVSDSGAGLDIALWQHDAGRWLRLPLTGGTLAADGEQQPAGHAIALREDGLLVAGSVTTFGDGARTQAAIWTAPTADGPWARTPLPTAGDGLAAAQAAACATDGRCLVAGHARGRLAAWTVSPTGAVTAVGVPDVPAGPAPVRITAHVRAGVDAIVVSTPDGGERHVLVTVDGTWREAQLPAGSLVGLTLTDAALWLATASPSGARLWTGPLPAS